MISIETFLNFYARLRYDQLYVCMYCESAVLLVLFTWRCRIFLLPMALRHTCFSAYICLTLASIFTMKYVLSPFITPLPQRYEKYLQSMWIFEIHSIWALMTSDLGVLWWLVLIYDYLMLVSFFLLLAKLQQW